METKVLTFVYKVLGKFINKKYLRTIVLRKRQLRCNKQGIAFVLHE